MSVFKDGQKFSLINLFFLEVSENSTNQNEQSQLGNNSNVNETTRVIITLYFLIFIDSGPF